MDTPSDNPTEKVGAVPSHSLAWIAVATDHYAAASIRWVRVGNASCLFRKDGDLAYCLFEGMPVIQSGPFSALELARSGIEGLGVMAVYFSLCYIDFGCTEALMRLPGAVVLRRRPSMFVDWSRRGTDVWARCENRLGKRAARRRRAFESSRCTVAAEAPELAISAVAEVERQSWKAQVGQDMHTRQQLTLYARLLSSHTATATIVRDGGRPVAYRIDQRVGDVLYCLKWSFDEAYRRISPGFYLVACDLPVQWREADVARVDLYGSPDALKDCVATGRQERVDIGWPHTERTAAAMAERAKHDALTAAAHAAGLGVRTPYVMDVNA